VEKAGVAEFHLTPRSIRIEKAFGVKMDTLMRMQAAYDIAQTRKRENDIQVRRIHQLADQRA
jgi:plasmid maintenance system antidote protein VapI